MAEVGLRILKEKRGGKEISKVEYLWVYGSLNIIEKKEVKTPQEVRGWGREEPKMEKKLWKRWEGSEERMEKRAGGETVGKDEGEH